MGAVVQLHDPSNYVWAARLIKRLWNEGTFTLHPHAKQRMEERGLDILDIQHILRYGRVVDHTKPQHLWRYKVQGTALDGRRASCLVETDINSIIIITVLGRRRR